jgi:hypothetical protein
MYEPNIGSNSNRHRVVDPGRPAARRFGERSDGGERGRAARALGHALSRVAACLRAVRLASSPRSSRAWRDEGRHLRADAVRRHGHGIREEDRSSSSSPCAAFTLAHAPGGAGRHRGGING